MRVSKPFFIFLILFAGTTVISGCNDKGNIEGKYINEQTKGRWFVIDSIDFKNDYCNFYIWGHQTGEKYKIDKDYIFIETGDDFFGTVSLKIISHDTLVGDYGKFVKGKL